MLTANATDAILCILQRQDSGGEPRIAVIKTGAGRRNDEDSELATRLLRKSAVMDDAHTRRQLQEHTSNRLRVSRNAGETQK